MLKLILPAIITIIGNIIFYLLVKGRVDKSIEENKIAYGGIYKEKVHLYRDLLSKTYDLKKDLNVFQYIGNQEDATLILNKINDYIHFYLTNQPFLSEDMLTELNNIRAEYQDVFEKFYRHIAGQNVDNLDEFFEAGNKLKTDIPFKAIEDRIVKEMRRDLKMDNFKK